MRHYLKKSQNELARLLGISTRAVQSYEEGWRNIPSSAERQLRTPMLGGEGVS